MEIQTLFEQLKQLTTSKSNQLYNGATIILDSIYPSISKVSPQQQGTAIFASLISLIQLDMQELAKQQPDNISSKLFLLNNLIPKYNNRGVLQKYISILQQISNAFISNSEQIVQKYCIAILTQVIIIRNEFDEQSCKIIINNLNNNNPITKKQAQKSLRQILAKKPEQKLKLSSTIKDFIIEQINSQDDNFNINACLFLNNEETIQQLTIQALGDIIYGISKKIQIMSEASVLTHFFLTIETIMAQRPFNADVSENLIKDLLNNQPSFYEDEKVTLAFCQCICQSLFNLQTISRKTSNKFIPSVLSMLQEVLQVKDENKQNKLQQFVVKTYELIFINCIKPALWNPNLEQAQSEESDIFQISNMDILDEKEIQQQKQEESKLKATVFQRIVVVITYLLDPRFEALQKHSLAIIGTFFERLDESCIDQIQELILKVIQMRKTALTQSWENCMSKLIESLGVYKLLDICPVTLTNLDSTSPKFEDDNNLWILSLLIKYAKNQSIMVFLNKFYPIISQIDQLIQQFKNDQQNIQSKIYQSLRMQFWNCLPNLSSISRKQEENEYVALQKFMTSVEQLLQENLEEFGFALLGLKNLVYYSFAGKDEKAQKIIQPLAQKLISHLAKMYQPDKKSEKNKLMLTIIRALSQLAPQEYLRSRFQLNVDKLVAQNMQQLAENKTIEMQKNLDILIEVTGAIQVKDKVWELGMKLVKTLLPLQSKFQKKGYKFLNLLIQNVHPSFLSQVIEILKENEQTEQYSRFYRLTCVSQIYHRQQLDSIIAEKKEDLAEFMQIFLPEIIIGLRDSNKKTRKISKAIFESITNQMIKIGNIKDFCSMVSAGLAGSSLMQADTIAATGFLIEKFFSQFDSEYIKQVFELTMLLLKNPSKEVFKALLYFIKKYQKVEDKVFIESQMKNIFKQIFDVEEVIRDKLLTQIKYLLLRFIKKFGVEKVEEALPEEHKKLPRAINKQERQKKNKREKNKIEYKKLKEQGKVHNSKEKNKIEEEDDEQQELDRNNLNNGQKVQKLYEKNLNKIEEEEEDQNLNTDNKNPKDNQDNDANNLLLKYDSKKQQFHFVEHTVKKVKEKLKQEQQQLKDVLYKNGQIIVQEIEDEEVTGKKRRREDKFDSYQKITDIDNDNKKQPQNQPEEKKILYKSKKERFSSKNQLVHNVVESGDMYKPQGSMTGGDVKIKGKPDPYAYIQLNPKSLNKRFKNKSQKTFDVVLNQQSTGALKGLKVKKVKPNQ